MFTIIIRDAALEMLNDAYLWYEQQLPGLGERLFAEIDGCIEKLSHNPTYFSLDKENYRKAILKNFPYKIVFEIVGADVIIYAVFHTSRNPNKMFS
jgi:plasmid stabilization system protein ParE